MSSLLEIKEQIKMIYGKYETFIMPVLKMLLAMITLLCINGELGYMSKIDSFAIVLMVSLLCSFLPKGFIAFFAAVFVLLHSYALAIEAALVCFCLFLVMALLFFRFSPKDALVVVLTPVCFGLKIPYVIPLVMGLIGTPASAISVGCGVVVYYFIHSLSVNAPAINTAAAEEATARLRMVIDGILDNKELLITVAAFVFTVVLVYCIRRMSIDHSWTIAMVAGAVMNMIILLLGDLIYDANVSVVGVIFGSLISVGLCVVLQFFVFSVDYSRTEKVQFEDDEYYYYVKAVPKMTVATPEKTVKRINTPTGRSVGQAGPRQAVRSSSYGNQRTPIRQAPSRTISTQNTNRTYRERAVEQAEEVTDDYEEI